MLLLFKTVCLVVLWPNSIFNHITTYMTSHKLNKIHFSQQRFPEGVLPGDPVQADLDVRRAGVGAAHLGTADDRRGGHEGQHDLHEVHDDQQAGAVVLAGAEVVRRGHQSQVPPICHWLVY